MGKAVWTGWIGKKSDINRCFVWDETGSIFLDTVLIPMEAVVKTKGKRIEWAKGNWPPRKVRVTVEEVG